ncbi:hypothetical protein HPULCUR_010676 [Helicostylum pulchrum]|uniref:Uncharacterized protein n=1 Tax=Helicostylum pulchrum TaxID=562976 RepID=A0ABP9YEW9_9FUNG
MASQRNNIALPEVQMLLQRTIMNESPSILGKLDNLGATINDLKEDAIAAKEENMSLKEELSSLKNKINMIYSSVGNYLSVPSPRFAGEATGSVEKNGLFSDNLVTGRPMTKEEFDGCCEDNVNIGVLNPVMYTIKKRYDLLKKPINFAKLPSEAELLSEEKAAPFSPLAADFYQISLPLLLDLSLENHIVEGPLLERAEGETATKAIQRKRGRPSTKKKTTVCIVIVDYAGLSTNPDDIRTLVK